VGLPAPGQAPAASFVLAGFVGRALPLCAGGTPCPSAAGLRLPTRERPALDAFLQGKTRIDKTAFSPQD